MGSPLRHEAGDKPLCANMIETSSHPAITDSQRAEKDMREHGCYSEAQWRSTKDRVSRAGAEGRRAERALRERSACYLAATGTRGHRGGRQGATANVLRH